ncbi:unnamed protein product [Coccothraustes coccothraustes]
MQALRKAEDANVELSGAKRRARAAFGSSRALESTGTGTMLSARKSRFFASGSRRARPLLRPEERRSTTVAFSAQPSNSSRTQKRFGEQRHRHNAQCAKKPLLRLRQPESTAAAETSRTKKHNSGILCAALKLIKDVPGAGGFRQQPRFGEQRHRHNAQCAKKPLLRLRHPESTAAAETSRTKKHNSGILCAALKLIKDERVEKLSAKIQALRKAEDANVELSGAKRRARAAFGSSRALESSGTGTMLSARRSRFFASGSRRARPLLRPQERRSTTVAFSAQPSNSSRTVPFQLTTF